MTNHTGWTKLDMVREQAAYRRRVAAFGLPALLAPYTRLRLARVPQQRRRRP